MNQDVMKEWIERLRSGRIGQARKKLRDGGDRCCLGVLCDVYADSAAGRWTDDEFFWADGESEHLVLPVPVAVWAGLDSLEGSWDEDPEHTLVWMNDSGRTFSEIADTIEKYFS